MTGPRVYLQSSSKPALCGGGWNAVVVVRDAATLERLGEYVSREAFNNRAFALEEAETYARGWRTDFERQRGHGFAEVVPNGELAPALN